MQIFKKIGKITVMFMMAAIFVLLAGKDAFADELPVIDKDKLTFAYDETNRTAVVTGTKDSVTTASVLSIPGEIRHNDQMYPVVGIADEAFKGEGNLTGKLVIPENVKYIGASAFEGCTGFHDEVIFPKSLEIIEENAFEECTGIECELKFYDSLSQIGEGAFYNCQTLRGSIHFPDSLTSIGDNAFRDCKGLNGTLTFERGLDTIGKNAFSGDSGLVGMLTIPEGTSLVDEYAFSRCTKLTGVTIERNVGLIKGYAFGNLNIKDVYIKGKKQEYAGAVNGANANSVFSDVPRDCLFHCIPGCDAETWIRQRLENTIVSLASYTVYFSPVADASGYMEPISCYTDATYSLPKAIYSRDGFYFAGWNTKADGTGKTYQDGASIKDLATEDGAVVSLYAQWKPCDYIVKFNANGGNGVMADMGLKYGESRRIAGKYTKPGYVISGWNTQPGGNGISFAPDAYLRNLAGKNGAVITLYAMWSPASYRIKFVKNGGTGSMSRINVTYGKAVSLPKVSFTRKGYTFKNWNTEPDGTGSTYKNLSSVINLSTENNDVVGLYAQWKPITYNIKFKANGGTGKMSTIKKVEYDDKLHLPPNEFVKEGYKFIGWSTQKTAKKAEYKNRAVVKKLTAKKNSTVTLYAVWKKSK